MEIKAPRGTSDVLPEKAAIWDYLESKVVDIFTNFGYKKIILPVFEHTEIFQRGIGQSTDIVQKEMYTFEDKGGRSLTLRPEGTASVVRSFIENKMWNNPLPVKLYYIGPMFRYERPQSGRYREFWQMGAEALGSDDPFLDVEMIILLMDYFRSLKLNKLELKINSMGCSKCQPAYTGDLKKFIEPNLEKICKQCQKRYEKNPLRIFDCKNKECQKIYGDAPKLTDYLCQECKMHFDQVKDALTENNEDFEVDKSLVRGFDYYTKTTFEICSPVLGAQNAIGGGGRYDGLIESYGGPPNPGIGFALGIERMILAMQAEERMPGPKRINDVFVVSVDKDSKPEVFKLLMELRRSGISAEMDFAERSLRSQMKQADKKKAEYALILGPDEIKSGVCTIKDLINGTQENIKRNKVLEYLLKKKRVNERKN